MKLVTTRPVAKSAITPLFFVHSTLRNFILCFHLRLLLSVLIATENLLLVRVTLWKLAWYYHNRRPADRSFTALPRLLRTLIHAHSFTLHFSRFTSYSSPSSFVGDSSHASSPGDVGTGFVGDDPGPPVVLPMRPDTLRRSPSTLRPMTNTKAASMRIVAGAGVTPARVVEPDPVVTPPMLPTLSALSYTTLA